MSLTLRYMSQLQIVKPATHILRTIPRGSPEWKNANGRPTIPPPMMVLIRLKLASFVFIPFSESPDAKNDAVNFFGPAIDATMIAS